MKKIILIAVLSLIALPAFGAVSYSRTPAGTSITSPITIFVQGTKDQNFYNIIVDDIYFSSCFSREELIAGIYQTIDLPLGDYKIIILRPAVIGNCENVGYNPEILEYNNDNPIFTIIAGGGISIISGLTMASSSDMLASVGSLFTDLWVIIALVIGIPLAFYIIQRTIKLVPAKGRIKNQ